MIKRQLLLIHGWAINKAIWTQLEQSLKDEINVVNINLQGYGQGDTIPLPYSLTNLASAIAPYLDKAEQSIVLGWSLGGLVAIELAALYPQQISQLILVASNPKFIQSEDWPYAVEKQLFIDFSKLLKQDIKKTIKRFIAIQAMGSHSVKEDIKTIQQLIEQSATADYDTLSKGLILLLSCDQRQKLLSLTQPVLMIAGNRDNLVKIDGLEFLCQQSFNKRTNKKENLSLEVISGAGHAPFISHFKLFNTILRKNLGLNFE